MKKYDYSYQTYDMTFNNITESFKIRSDSGWRMFKVIKPKTSLGATSMSIIWERKRIEDGK